MRLLISSFLILFSVSSFAQSVVLSQVTAGGMAGPTGPLYYRTSVLSDGSVVSEHGVAPNVVRKAVAQLSPESLKSIQNEIAKLDMSVQLTKPDPKAGMCMDAPFTHVEITQGDKTAVIWAKENCLVTQRTDWGGQDLVQIIEGFSRL